MESENSRCELDDCGRKVKLTCFSCLNWKHDGCFHGRNGWPIIGFDCLGFEYEPGVDEDACYAQAKVKRGKDDEIES